MSIEMRIAALEAPGAPTPLTRYKLMGGLPAKRRLYLTGAAMADLTNSSSAINLLSDRGRIDAALHRWVSGGRVFGNKKRGLFIDRLDPPPNEVWEIRITEPLVQVRGMVRFAAANTIIVTKFYTRPFLGDYGSHNWGTAMSDCVAQWGILFPDHTPHIRATIGEYVTENVDDFPI